MSGMPLSEAISATGMTPPSAVRIVPGKWIRFPGVGKGPRNGSGWLRLINEQVAVFGDWSTGEQHVWHAEADKPIDRKAAAAAVRLAREADQRRRDVAARAANAMVFEAKPGFHPYLAMKGFPTEVGLVHGDLLVIPARAVESYRRIITVQTIDADGNKLFLKHGRAKGAIYRIGPQQPHTALCEGYATGLTLRDAFSLLGHWQVVVCFSASNLIEVSRHYPKALVCADHDVSQTGQRAAIDTGLKWVMPPTAGDFNDMQQRAGLRAVMDVLREAPS